MVKITILILKIIIESTKKVQKSDFKENFETSKVSNHP